jgi:hypothetical protein
LRKDIVAKEYGAIPYFGHSKLLYQRRRVMCNQVRDILLEDGTLKELSELEELLACASLECGW